MAHFDEFSLIGAYFKRADSFLNTESTAQIDLGVGDDAALFRVSPNHQCVVSSDMLVQDRHFFADVAPCTLGHKVLAVNLSDLAAMGAQPLGFTLSVGLPEINTAWLDEFCAGLFALSDEYACPLIGGDTTRSPILVLNVTIFGQVPTGQAIVRSGAQMGDDIYVTGQLGAPAYALELLTNQHRSAQQEHDLTQVHARLEQPTPRVALGQDLRGIASSMLDLSDGLAGDLRHILRASNVSARIDLDALPIHPALKHLERTAALRAALCGGDEYELCFTVPKNSDGSELQSTIQSLEKHHGVRITRIGQIIHSSPSSWPETAQIEWYSRDAALVERMRDAATWSGYQHF